MFCLKVASNFNYWEYKSFEHISGIWCPFNTLPDHCSCLLSKFLVMSGSSLEIFLLEGSSVDWACKQGPHTQLFSLLNKFRCITITQTYKWHIILFFVHCRVKFNCVSSDQTELSVSALNFQCLLALLIGNFVVRNLVHQASNKKQAECLLLPWLIIWPWKWSQYTEPLNAWYNTFCTPQICCMAIQLRM